ncbi:uncharacterized protein C2845_PM02G40420 [Panicum miliaceum]|uniref:Uncharacterized protein n=1 Tax=Panicum miliaceum TaxID=4540 RepID=A0A3L6S8L4_PANMI|nr:uncharacterized protein C2845_PM02G40420 [Panicum miliaceum]
MRAMAVKFISEGKTPVRTSGRSCEWTNLPLLYLFVYTEGSNRSASPTLARLSRVLRCAAGHAVLRCRKGTRSLPSDDKQHSPLALFWDLTIAKYAAASSPEPVFGFYFVANAEVVLVVGDLDAEFEGQMPSGVRDLELKSLRLATISSRNGHTISPQLSLSLCCILPGPCMEIHGAGNGRHKLAGGSGGVAERRGAYEMKSDERDRHGKDEMQSA